MGDWGGSLLPLSPRMQETQVCHPAAACHCLDKLSDLPSAVQRAAASSLPELYPCPGGPLATITGHSLRAESRSQTRRSAGTVMPCAFFLRDVGTESAETEILRCANNRETCANMTLHLHPTNTGSSIGSTHSADYSPWTWAINKSTINKKAVVIKWWTTEAILSGLHNLRLWVTRTPHWRRKQVCICHRDQHRLGYRIAETTFPQ